MSSHQKPQGSYTAERKKVFPSAWQQVAFFAEGRSRGDLVPARLPDPPGCQRRAWEPWAAPGFLAAPPLSAAGTNMAWQGWREKEAAPIPTACCLFLMVNSNSITASHRSQGAAAWAAQVPPQLRRCGGSASAAVGSGCLRGVGQDVSPRVLPQGCLLGTWSFNFSSFAS